MPGQPHRIHIAVGDDAASGSPQKLRQRVMHAQNRRLVKKSGKFIGRLMNGHGKSAFHAKKWME